LIASLTLALATGVIGYVTIERVLIAFGTKADILGDAVAFARANFVVVPILFVFNLYMNLMRGIGDTKSPFVALLIGTGL